MSSQTLPTRITSPRSAFEYLQRMHSREAHGFFGLLSLDHKGELLGDSIIPKGTNPRGFYREALKHGAFTALAYTFRPSNNVSPSKEDLDFTARLRSAGESLGVPLSDHIILGIDWIHSFRSAQGWQNEGNL